MLLKVLTSAFVAMFLFTTAQADEVPVFKIFLKDHKFSQAVVKVPANQKFKLEVKNEDNSSEEFESNVLNIEKIVGPKKTLRLVLGPLKPGTYPFFGEFNLATAKGDIVAE